MDLLTWPNVTLDQLHEFVPSLAQLEPSLLERIIIEGKYKKQNKTKGDSSHSI
jgi:tRNA uridine 5-carboxymethylaminomethyl modification enzyme